MSKNDEVEQSYLGDSHLNEVLAKYPALKEYKAAFGSDTKKKILMACFVHERVKQKQISEFTHTSIQNVNNHVVLLVESGLLKRKNDEYTLADAELIFAFFKRELLNQSAFDTTGALTWGGQRGVAFKKFVDDVFFSNYTKLVLLYLSAGGESAQIDFITLKEICGEIYRLYKTGGVNVKNKSIIGFIERNTDFFSQCELFIRASIATGRSIASGAGSSLCEPSTERLKELYEM